MSAPACVLPHPDEVVLPAGVARVRRRGLLLGLVLVVIIIVLLVTNVVMGKVEISPSQLLEILRGRGEGLDNTIVLEWRLPRALTAVAAGAALAVAGAITQTLSRNPLASPDLLGVTMGASVGAVCALVFLPSALLAKVGPVLVTGAAVLGGMCAAGLILWLSWRGEVDPLRLVLMGIGVQTLGGALISLVLVRTSVYKAGDVVSWLTGSLTGRGWRDVIVISVGLIVVAPVLWVLASRLSTLSLGEECAAGLGANPSGTVVACWACAVGLSAAAVSACGPIGFVALAAPQLARLLFARPVPPIIGSGVVGAVVLLAADTGVRFLLDEDLPVGVITAGAGAPFLIFFLIQNDRRNTL